MNIRRKIRASHSSAATTPRHAWPRSAWGLGLVALVALSGCATTSPAYHEYVMQGQVLSVEGNQLVVCVGERDGAKLDQVLDVIRHVSIAGPPKASHPSFKREDIGTVRIVTVFDEHYATAEIVKGIPKVGDTVELDRK